MSTAPDGNDVAERRRLGPAPRPQQAVVIAGVWPTVALAVPLSLSLPVLVDGSDAAATPFLLLGAYVGLAFLAWRFSRPDARPVLFVGALAQAASVVAGGQAMLPATLVLSGAVVLSLSLCCGLAGLLSALAGLSLASSLAVLLEGSSGPAPELAWAATGSLVTLGAIGLAYARSAARREQMFSDLFTQLDASLVVFEDDLHGDWRTAAVNPAARARLELDGSGVGLARGSLRGPEADPEVGAALERAKRDGLPQRLAIQGSPGHGGPYSVTVVVGARTDSAPRRATVSVHDRSHERRSVDALATTERLLTGVLEAVPLALYWLDAEGRLSGCNSRYARLAGFATPAELLAAAARVVRPGGEQALRDDQRLLQGQAADTQAPERLLVPVGASFDERWMERSRVPLRGPGGQVAGLVGALLDVTAARRSDHRFLDARRLSSAGRLATAFVHEFRNLLLVIDANARLVQDGLPPASPVRDDLDQIASAGRRAASLVARLEAFTTPGTPTGSPGPHALDAVVRDTSFLLRKLVRAEVTLVDVLEAPGVLVGADRSLLQQSLLEVAWAIADRLPAGSRLRVSTAPLAEDDVAQGRVPGRGPFAQVTFDASQPTGASSPAGSLPGALADLADAITAELGGQLVADHAPGAGVRLRLVLPVVRADEPRGVAMLVEDDAKLRATLGRLLRGEGFTVLESANAERALGQLGDLDALDLLVADVVLPGQDGTAVARAVLGAYPRAAVILASAAGLGVVRPLVDGLAPAVPVVLAKPYSAAVLSGAIRDALDEARARPH